MIDPRALLDTYATQDPFDGDARNITREQAAAEAIAALRMLLELADHYDDINDRMWTSSAADDLRHAITTALETTMPDPDIRTDAEVLDDLIEADGPPR